MKKQINIIRKRDIFAIFGLLISVLSTNLQASTAPILGSVQNFAVLAASTVTNTGPSVITGDMGLSPGTAIIGFPPGLVSGTIHGTDATAAQAQVDLTAAYINLENQSCDVDLSGQDLGGLVLTKGTYCFTSSAQLTGTLTLDAEGDPDAVFIFQVKSALTTDTNSNVVIKNFGKQCNVFWQIGSSATLAIGTNFIGNILALTSITVNEGAKIQGRLLARNAAIVLHNNIINKTDCDSEPTPINDNYNYTCEFESNKGKPVNCLVSGDFCVTNPQASEACPSPDALIEISCDDGFKFEDTNAQSLYNNLLLLIQGEDIFSLISIDIQNFKNQPGLYESNLELEYKNSSEAFNGTCKVLSTSPFL